MSETRDAAGHATGDTTGLALPADPEALRRQGAAFLTDAFRSYGMLAHDNRVTRIARFEEFHGGNSGAKAVLDVSYAEPSNALPTRLFAKFSRDFSDAFRDRRRFELEGEVRLADLSRHPNFPVAVPRAMFADFDRATGTGLLITERVAFGEGAIEPLHEKCMDHLLDDPFDHYRVLVEAQASLAAAQKAGRLSPDLERLFPYHRSAAEADLPIGYGPGDLEEKVADWAALAREAPAAFPVSLGSGDFARRLLTDARAFLTHESRVRRFLQSDPDFIALCHWNTNIDNAWFYRTADGALACGLLDWGMARQMNVTTGLWGGLSACDTAFLEANLDRLLDHYCHYLARRGGPRLDRDRLGLHFDLSLAITGLALMMDIPGLIRERAPAYRDATGPVDRVFSEGKAVQGFVLVTGNFLNLWTRRDFGQSLRRMLETDQARGR
ncbi:hypothetical protein B2G71_10695 [Novosphingobium sp. PC22D]|uniref:hypothetical protein n=1 Tax=Novosphingobium sp. PC22D TaxID=1962403 RepID=UPI000BF00BC0|nr:hypothetical protein [Novosphingobium sp. PC22D]PEQ12755.1 hypothetical protein B2G71_10695 [Novosphingobium sp. PC22D]